MKRNSQVCRIAAAACLVAGLAAVGVLLAWIVRGDVPFRMGPLAHVTLWCLAVAAGFFGWGILRRAGEPGSVKKLFARFVLLGVSAAVSVAVAELAFRRVITKKLDAGSFESFKKLKLSGSDIHVHSASPLATIIRPSDEPNLVYDLQPNLNTNFGNHRLVINADGQREEHLYARERTPGSVRVLGLGDSGMFGWGLEQGGNYLDVMEAVLNRHGNGSTVEAINTGTPGYNTQLELQLLKVRGLAYHPDIVVVGWCENDFYLPHFFLKKNKLPERRSLIWDLMFHRELFQRELQPQELADRETAKGDMGKVDMDSVPDGLKAGLYEDGVRAALAEMQRLSAEQGFKLLVFGPLKPDILAIVDSLGIDRVNTLEKISADQYPLEWLVHAMHPRAEGHRVLGELLAAELDARGWLKPAPLQARAGSTPP